MTSESAQEYTTCIKKLRVENKLGLHARPAACIVKLLLSSMSSVTFKYKRQTVDARSILHLLMLGAPHNAMITVSVNGPDAEAVLAKLELAFQQQFGEENSGW
jgi:phosphocarrier protein HPr